MVPAGMRMHRMHAAQHHAGRDRNITGVKYVREDSLSRLSFFLFRRAAYPFLICIPLNAMAFSHTLSKDIYMA